MSVSNIRVIHRALVAIFAALIFFIITQVGNVFRQGVVEKFVDTSTSLRLSSDHSVNTRMLEGHAVSDGGDNTENSLWTTYMENDDIYTAAMRFNRDISDTLQQRHRASGERLHSTPFCDVRMTWSRDRMQPITVPRTFTSLRQLLQLPLLGTASWRQNYESKTMSRKRRFVSSAFARSRYLRQVTNLQFYNTRSSIAGVEKFVLSSRENQHSRTAVFRSNVSHYYTCHASTRLSESGGWWKYARNVLPSICNQRCTTDLAVFNRSLPIPDYALHTDFYQVLYASACQNRDRTSLFPSIVNDYALHNNLTGDVLMSLYVVQEGGVVFNSHGVLTRSLTFFQAYGCASTPQFYTNFPNAFRNILRTVNNLKCLPTNLK